MKSNIFKLEIGEWVVASIFYYKREEPSYLVEGATYVTDQSLGAKFFYQVSKDR